MNDDKQFPLPRIPLKDSNGSVSLLKVMQYVVFAGIILYYGKSLLIPLSFAVLISFILFPLCRWFENKRWPRPLAIATSLLLLILLTVAVFILLLQQFISFTREWSMLKHRLIDAVDDLSLYLSETFNVSLFQQHLWLENLADETGQKILPFIGSTFYSLSIFSVLLILVPVMSALILYHRENLMEALYRMLPNYSRGMIRQTMHDTIHSYYQFIKGMGVVYLSVGILNSIGLAIIGVPHPILFGFIASVLTFIPYVGIIAGSLLPISVSWLTYDSLYYPFAVIMVFVIVQYIEANIIFPFAVSTRLKVNTLATIVMIVAGGILWGASGMILFVPFLGILKLIADRVESLKPLSILIGVNK